MIPGSSSRLSSFRELLAISIGDEYLSLEPSVGFIYPISELYSHTGSSVQSEHDKHHKRWNQQTNVMGLQAREETRLLQSY